MLCSRSKQSRCLFDKSTTSNILDHGSNGILPGERFDANQQCKLKYGSTSQHSPTQQLEDICKDLQCARDNYIWTSHPALEGTICGNNKVPFHHPVLLITFAKFVEIFNVCYCSSSGVVAVDVLKKDSRSWKLDTLRIK